MNDEHIDLPLDDRPGPARRIDDAAKHAMITAALDEVVPDKKPNKRLILVAAAALVVASTSVASAAFVYEKWIAPEPELVEPTPRRVVEAPEPAEEEAPDWEPELLEAKRKAPARRPIGELLRQANDLRAAKRYRSAEKKYMQVVKRAPRSDEAYVARVAAASLRAERLGDPKRAIRLFERARKARPNGELDAEILFGLADAYRRTKNEDRERTTLERLVKRHPRSLQATQARVRLGELAP